MSTHIGIGTSTNLDSERAGKEAAKMALSSFSEVEPNIVFVYMSTIFDQDKAIEGIRSILPRTPLVGISSIASITSLGSFRNSITVAAISSDIIKFSHGIISKVSENPAVASTKLATNLSNDLGNISRQLLILLSNNLSANASLVLNGAQVALGTSFPIIGGSSSDDLKFEASYQYFNDKINTDSAVGALMGGNIAFGIGRNNAWFPIGRPHRITKSSSNIVKEIDKKRACELYEEYLNKTMIDLKAEGIAKLGSRYPLGSKIQNGDEYLTRSPLRIADNDSILLSGELPENQDIHIMKSDRSSIIESTKSACLRAIKHLDKTKLRFAIVFSDISRYQVLQKDTQIEVDTIKEVLGKNVPFFGCYTFGEYGPIDQEKYLGQSYFHNQSITITCFTE